MICYKYNCYTVDIIIIKRKKERRLFCCCCCCCCIWSILLPCIFLEGYLSFIKFVSEEMVIVYRRTNRHMDGRRTKTDHNRKLNYNYAPKANIYILPHSITYVVIFLSSVPATCRSSLAQLMLIY